MLSYWKQCVIFILFFSIVVSEGSRLPKASTTWEQMLPKKLPSPSSAPSKGTNSVTTSYTTTKINRKMSSDDGRV